MKRILYIIIGIALSTAVWAQDTEGEEQQTFTVVDALQQTPSLSVFNRLVEACNLRAELSKVRDEVYEEMYMTGQIQDLPYHPSEGSVGYLPEHRYYGYTVFAETDDFWQQTLGKPAAGITVSDVEMWVAKQRQTLRDFVRYHILPRRLSPDKLVIHYNEKGYDYRTSMNFTIPTYEVYETLGGGQLLKLYQCGPAFSLDGSSDIFLNRTPVLDDGMHGDLHEVSVTPATEGIRLIDSLSISVRNGYIYPINKPLIYTDEVRREVFGGRIRYDFAGLFPELMNNGIRPDRIGNQRSKHIGLPANSAYQYCEGLDIQDGTYFYYLSGFGNYWYNWQGDEFNITGFADFTVQLPPVPTDGEYELRIAVQSNSSARGICQFYVGTDKSHLRQAGLPVDMREGGQYIRTSSGQMPSTVGWEADDDDEFYNRIVDLRLYEAGYMKGPANCTPMGYGNTLRNYDSTLRRIVWRGQVKAGQPMYLRVRSILDDTSRQIYLDYMEWCPKSVYANSDKPEDIW